MDAFPPARRGQSGQEVTTRRATPRDRTTVVNTGTFSRPHDPIEVERLENPTHMPHQPLILAGSQ
jgi:hypothetical protein